MIVSFISHVMFEREAHIIEKIKKIKDPNLPYEEKRKMVLEKEDSHTYYFDDIAEINDKKKVISFYFNIDKSINVNSIEKLKNKFMFKKLDIKNYVYSNERKTERGLMCVFSYS